MFNTLFNERFNEKLEPPYRNPTGPGDYNSDINFGKRIVSS